MVVGSLMVLYSVILMLFSFHECKLVKGILL